MLPQKPKSHHMNTSHQSLPLPGPKAFKALGLIVLPSQHPNEVPPLHPQLGQPVLPTSGEWPWAALTLVSLSLVPIQVAAQAVPCLWL